MRGAGDSNSASFSDLLQSRRNIDAVAEYVVALDDDITQVHADPEADGVLVGDAAVAFGHACLNADAAFDGGDDTWELQQQPVAHRLDDATALFGDQGIDQF